MDAEARLVIRGIAKANILAMHEILDNRVAKIESAYEGADLCGEQAYLDAMACRDRADDAAFNLSCTMQEMHEMQMDEDEDCEEHPVFDLDFRS